MPAADDGARRRRDDRARVQDAVDQPERFLSSAALGAYFGLTPSKYASGETNFRSHGPITICGDKIVGVPALEALIFAGQIGGDRERFPYVGFKGGSEIGVFAGNWLLARDDGRRFVMTFALNDSTKGLDPLAVVETLQPAANVLIYETP